MLVCSLGALVTAAAAFSLSFSNNKGCERANVHSLGASDTFCKASLLELEELESVPCAEEESFQVQ